MSAILTIDQNITFKIFENVFKEYVHYDTLVKEIVDVTKELDSIDLIAGSIDFENFEDQYKISGSIGERSSVIFSNFSIYKKKYKKWFDKLIFLRMKDDDIRGNTKEDRKHYVDLDLVKYHVVLEHIDYIIDKAELVKEIYLNRHTSLSRLLSYLEYKNNYMLKNV